MDSVLKFKESNQHVNISLAQTQTSAKVGNSHTEICNIIPLLHNESISSHSIELNAATSLSDDSGLPHTTNSSISSNDSCRIGVYKLEVEVMESDGDISQFGSFDNFSESGMSAEIFNTLKKVPLAPIDPPPEFQDSPRSTLVKTMPKTVFSALRRWTSSQSSFEHLKDNNEDLSKLYYLDEFSKNESFDRNFEKASKPEDVKTIKEIYSATKHLYSSDSILTSHTDNIYDEPNCITSNSCGSSLDEIETSQQIPPPPPPVSLHKIKQTLCPYYQDHSRYFKAIESETDHISTQKSNPYFLSDVPRSDLKRYLYQQLDSQMQNKHHMNSLSSSVCCNNPGVISYINRPHSRNSLNSRLSSSHNSLSVASANKADDSIFITQAMSHDALLTSEISDFYNVPLDSDIYALPVDMIRSEMCFYNQVNKFSNEEEKFNKENGKSSKSHRTIFRNKRRKKTEENPENQNDAQNIEIKSAHSSVEIPLMMTENHVKNDIIAKSEPIPISLGEIKQLYQSFYSNSQTSAVIEKVSNVEADAVKLSKETLWRVSSVRSSSTRSTKENSEDLKSYNLNNNTTTLLPKCQNENLFKLAQKEEPRNGIETPTLNKQNINWDKKFQFNLNLKQKFCSIFRFRRSYSRCREKNPSKVEKNEENKGKFHSRALPPVPMKGTAQPEGNTMLEKKAESQAFHFTTSIEKVKDYGWYWGPLSCEAAEKVLSNEPDGSFIVRDSSDDHYIFSLSFKLNNCVRHVRIEQDQGTFSFGSYAKFKSQTITEFIEKAVEHSRSGRYLFFLHRRPEHGPMRVQLTNPVSRFKHVQSLQHMCRFVILKAVIRKDLVQTLPLPRRLLDYLSYKHCYSEQIGNDNSLSQTYGDGSI